MQKRKCFSLSREYIARDEVGEERARDEATTSMIGEINALCTGHTPIHTQTINFQHRNQQYLGALS